MWSEEISVVAMYQREREGGRIEGKGCIGSGQE